MLRPLEEGEVQRPGDCRGDHRLHRHEQNEDANGGHIVLEFGERLPELDEEEGRREDDEARGPPAHRLLEAEAVLLVAELE